MKKPNLIVVFADQMRGMDLNCAGNSDVISPNFDRLAAEGTLFKQAYSNSPVCTPARGSLLTGLFPLSHGAICNDLPIKKEVPGIADFLNEQGYSTGYIGKWHLDTIPRDKKIEKDSRKGFKYWAVWNCSHNYYDAYYYENDDDKPTKIEGYEPIKQTDLAIDFIDKNKENPFCLFLSWGPPHDPYLMVPDKYKALYPPDKIKFRPNVDLTSDTARKVIWSYDKNGTDNELFAAYYAHITAIDEQMGRILDALAEKGLDEDTIVVFTSDHGDMLWSHGKMKKQQPYEESINIPFIIKYPPKVPKGKITNELISIVDMPATFLGLMNADGADKMQGRDLSQVVTGEKEGPESCFIMDLVNVLDESGRQKLYEWRGVRTKRYTYAKKQTGEDAILFDNQNDPYQMNNLIEDENYNEIKNNFKKMLNDWLSYADDDFADGKTIIKRAGFVKEWNEREEAMHPGFADLIEES